MKKPPEGGFPFFCFAAAHPDQTAERWDALGIEPIRAGFT
ncbi:hypothetical protein ABID77_001385 [Variovorax sp. PvP013]|jgi:hypothetical protein